MQTYLTIEEVAAEYRVPLSTLRYWRVRGEGPKSFKLGRRVVYLRRDLDAWVQAQYATATGGAA